MSKWHKLPRWKRKLHGFASYMLFAFFSLLNPEAADCAMHKVLTEQLTAAAKEGFIYE